MRAAIVFVVEDEQMQAKLVEVEGRLSSFVEQVAQDLAQQAAIEGGGVTPKLGAPWSYTAALGSAIVKAPEWWAHFLAGGTKAHGPETASKLHFFVNGEEVFADFVAGITADPFDKRAVAKTTGHLNSLIERAIA